ncbi:restriction endonuclease subunit S [Enterococcus thailandicus]|uniref:restriction endonuclease subunit S n=1 Tax=Enterococcus thailandicus TaxID=417368 RepID=UPI0032E519C7
MSNDTRPEIRFPGFTDDWEERKLGDVSNYSNGGSYESDVENRGKYELITLKSVDMFGNLVSSGKFINKKVPTLNKGTLVMILSEQSPGLLGMTAQIPKDDTFVLNQRVAEIHPNDDTNGYFLSMAINRSQAYFSKRGAGTKVQNISKSNVENFEFFIPIKHEQQKIGTFFKNLDDTITLHQRKLDLLKETKKGFLQKMFPKNGAKVPEIRFPGFTEDWEERKLQEVLRERNNQQPQSTEYPLVSFTVENGVTPKTDRYEREQLVVGDKSSKKYKVTVLNDIVYNPANLKFGAISRNKYGNAVFSPIYITFLVNNDVTTPEFIEMFVTRTDFIKRALKYQQGTVYERQSVSPTDLLAMNVYLPGKSEQEKIGSFFQQLDDTIALHQRKLDLLKETKKGFLQKMFV